MTTKEIALALAGGVVMAGVIACFVFILFTLEGV